MLNWVWELSEALPFLKWWFYGIVVALVLMYLSLDTFPGGRTDPSGCVVVFGGALGSGRSYGGRSEADRKSDDAPYAGEGR
jgi:hypothetical protein